MHLSYTVAMAAARMMRRRLSKEQQKRELSEKKSKFL